MRFRKLLNKLPHVDVPLSTGERLDRMIETQERILSEQARLEGMMSYHEDRVEILTKQIKDIKKVQDKPRPPEGLIDAINEGTGSTKGSLFPSSVVNAVREERQQLKQGRIIDSHIKPLSFLHKAGQLKNIEVFAQPMVTLPQRHTYAYELYARIVAKNGSYVPAARYSKSAEEINLLPEYDQTVLVKILSHIVDIDDEASDSRAPLFFLNLAPSTLKSADYLNTLLDFLKKHRHLVNRLVFEMSQQEYEQLSGKQAALMKALKKAGYRFSMDHIDRPQLNYKVLKIFGVEFLKFHAFYLMPVLRTSIGHERLRHMMKGLKMSGFQVIVDRVEQEREICEVLELDIPYAQGYLFGMPEKASHYNLLSEKVA